MTRRAAARRTGRRPGKQDTSAAILAAAREAFATAGYDGATIRQIAASAGVDPALVHHYFGSKEELFRATLQLPIDPDVLLPRVFADGPDQVAENLVRTFLGVWEGPVSGPAVASVLRNALSHRVAGRLAREFFATQIVRRMMTMLGDEVESSEVPLRTSLVMTQLFGVALGRYLLKLEPIASTPTETVVQAVAPTVHRYLFEDLRPKQT